MKTHLKAATKFTHKSPQTQIQTTFKRHSIGQISIKKTQDKNCSTKKNTINLSHNLNKIAIKKYSTNHTLRKKNPNLQHKNSKYTNAKKQNNDNILWKIWESINVLLTNNIIGALPHLKKYLKNTQIWSKIIQSIKKIKEDIKNILTIKPINIKIPNFLKTIRKILGPIISRFVDILNILNSIENINKIIKEVKKYGRSWKLFVDFLEQYLALISGISTSVKIDFISPELKSLKALL